MRIPGSSRYVLDLSGSKQGGRTASLKEAMLLLASNTTVPSQRYGRFQNREEVGIITFSSAPSLTGLFPMGSTPEENAKARGDITQFINSLDTGGATAIYSSLPRALIELARERSQAGEGRYYTVLLMTDGENNEGLDPTEFRNWYASEGDRIRGIRVFPILFGEGSQRERRHARRQALRLERPLASGGF